MAGLAAIATVDRKGRPHPGCQIPERWADREHVPRRFWPVAADGVTKGLLDAATAASAYRPICRLIVVRRRRRH
jgi:hypothetical protein